MDLVGEKQRTAQDLVAKLGKGLVKDAWPTGWSTAASSSAASHRLLGMLPRTRWPAADRPTRPEVRESIARVAGPGHHARRAHRRARRRALGHRPGRTRSIDHEGMSRREVKKRAKEVAEGAWAATAVRDAIQATNAAVVAAVAATGAAVAASGS